MPPKTATKKDEQRVPWGEPQTSLLVSACLDHLLLNRTTFYAVKGLEPWRAHGSDAINKQLQKFLKRHCRTVQGPCSCSSWKGQEGEW
jgi:hypothetical protein